MRSSVVLPEPLAPSTTQRWPGSTFHVSGARIVRLVAHEADVDKTQDCCADRGAGFGHETATISPRRVRVPVGTPNPLVPCALGCVGFW